MTDRTGYTYNANFVGEDLVNKITGIISSMQVRLLAELEHQSAIRRAQFRELQSSQDLQNHALEQDMRRVLEELKIISSHLYSITQHVDAHHVLITDIDKRVIELEHGKEG